MGRGPSIAGRKNAADSQRAKAFTKLIREITLAVRQGGTDPGGNPSLRLAMDRALDANMTKDAIERAVRRVSGESGPDAMQEIRYEGYAPGGVAIMVDCMTDNPTRTVADVRHGFSRHGGHLASAGSVAFQFTETGEVIFDIRQQPTLEEKILEEALEAGADDVQTAEGFTDVLTSPARLRDVKLALAKAGLVAIEADVVMRPSTRVSIKGETATAVRKLIDWLEALDDVQMVYHNADFLEDST